MDSSKLIDLTWARGRTFDVEGERLSIVGCFGNADAPRAILAFEDVSPLGRKGLGGVPTLDHGGYDLKWMFRTQ